MTPAIRVPAVALVLAGCSAPMSTFTGAGPEADALSALSWVLIAASAAVFLPVMVFMLMAIGRRRGREPVDLAPRNNRIPIVGGAIIPAVILFVLFLASLTTERQFPGDANVPATLFTIVGHQWWWEVQYRDPRGGPPIAFANELHVPVGQVVELRLLSADVIHSFWIPQLHGKMDLIPGDTNRIRFTASRAGTYRGQCAEYCGMQHANMAFTVVAETAAAYQQWLATQRQNAAAPADSAARLGAALVAGGPCATCHTIRGTTAHGLIGPDLTHVGSRLTLAAGTLPNNTATLEAWITNAPSLKPGTLMPALPQFTGVELRAITGYLQGLR